MTNLSPCLPHPPRKGPRFCCVLDQLLREADLMCIPSAIVWRCDLWGPPPCLYSVDPSAVPTFKSRPSLRDSLAPAPCFSTSCLKDVRTVAFCSSANMIRALFSLLLCLKQKTHVPLAGLLGFGRSINHTPHTSPVLPLWTRPPFWCLKKVSLSQQDLFVGCDRAFDIILGQICALLFSHLKVR